MPVEIRRALPREHEEAGRITAEAYREFVRPGKVEWSQYLERIADVSARAERTEVLVAMEGGQILGSATLELDGGMDDEDEPLEPYEARIRMLGVHPDARGRGVARQLMAACEERARSAGRTRMILNTTERMGPARHMYERLGYLRGQDRVFPDGFELLSYAKPLEP